VKEQPPPSRGKDPGASDPPDEGSRNEGELLLSLFLTEAERHFENMAAQHETLQRPQSTEAARTAIEPLLRTLHTLKGAAGSMGLERLEREIHLAEELCAEIRSGDLHPTAGMVEHLFDGIATMRAMVEGVRSAPHGELIRPPSSPAPEPIGPQRPERRSNTERRRGVDRRAQGERVLRVEAGRLDELAAGVGDLVILRTRLERRVSEVEGVLRDLNATRSAIRPGSTDDVASRLGELELFLTTSSAHLERAARALSAETQSLRRSTIDLDEGLRQARLCPLDAAFVRLPHALRQLERTSRVEADLVMGGADLDMDKTLVDQVSEVLLHLLRNAVAHGIESPETRQAQGKPRRGRIEVSAQQEDELIVIRFEDDGRGIDRGQVREALIRNRRLPPTTAFTEAEVLAALFDPGFSSRPAADGLSGRGMGLHIVQRTLAQLGGDVRLEDVPGRGTRFFLSLPQRAAITQAVLFKVGGQVYAVAAANVVRAVPLGLHALWVRRNERLSLADESGERPPLPVLRLQSLLGAETPPGGRGVGLEVRHQDRAFVITCDKIVGPRTIVLRPLSPLLLGLRLFAGSTISGSGKAQLVFDVGSLAKAAFAEGEPPPPPTRRAAARVLVVDDSRLGREATARALTAAGLQAITAEDGWDAWEQLGERRFDAVVTDLEMPRLSGLELIERIRRDPTLSRLPIIVLSSRTSPSSRDRARAAGADAVLAKGPQNRGVVEVVARLIRDPEVDPMQRLVRHQMQHPTRHPMHPGNQSITPPSGGRARH